MADETPPTTENDRRNPRHCYRLSDLQTWIERIATSTNDRTEAERPAEQGELPFDETQEETDTTNQEDEDA